MTKHSKEKLKNPEMSDGGKNWNVVTGCDKYSEGCPVLCALFLTCLHTRYFLHQ